MCDYLATRKTDLIFWLLHVFTWTVEDHSFFSCTLRDITRHLYCITCYFCFIFKNGITFFLVYIKWPVYYSCIWNTAKTSKKLDISSFSLVKVVFISTRLYFGCTVKCNLSIWWPQRNQNRLYFKIDVYRYQDQCNMHKQSHITYISLFVGKK